MTTQQPEALRLADELCEAIAEYPEPTALEAQAAAELRRLHNESVEVHAGYRTEQYWQGWNAALAAGQATAAQAVVPSGWNLVPTEPTQAMLDAVVTSMDDFLLGKEAEKQYREDWAAMLAAAPAQPVAEPTHAQIAAYLEATGAYVTNDASREAAIADAVEADRASRGQAPTGTTEPTEQQILEAAEKAGLLPNTVHSWIPAFHRYHKELAKAQPAPAQADSVLEDAARWREHVGKLDALVAYCPTCCQGFIAKQDMTRDEVLFACGKAVGQSGAKRLREALDLAVDHIDMDALRISHCKDAAVIDAARKQGATQ